MSHSIRRFPLSSLLTFLAQPTIPSTDFLKANEEGYLYPMNAPSRNVEKNQVLHLELSKSNVDVCRCIFFLLFPILELFYFINMNPHLPPSAKKKGCIFWHLKVPCMKVITVIHSVVSITDPKPTLSMTGLPCKNKYILRENLEIIY